MVPDAVDLAHAFVFLKPLPVNPASHCAMIYSSCDKTARATSVVCYHSSEENSCRRKSLRQDGYDCLKQTDATITTRRAAWDHYRSVFLLCCIDCILFHGIPILLQVILVA